jgi:hypothetical protein
LSLLQERIPGASWQGMEDRASAGNLDTRMEDSMESKESPKEVLVHDLDGEPIYASKEEIESKAGHKPYGREWVSPEGVRYAETEMLQKHLGCVLLLARTFRGLSEDIYQLYRPLYDQVKELNDGTSRPPETKRSIGACIDDISGNSGDAERDSDGSEVR